MPISGISSLIKKTSERRASTFDAIDVPFAALVDCPLTFHACACVCAQEYRADMAFAARQNSSSIAEVEPFELPDAVIVTLDCSEGLLALRGIAFDANHRRVAQLSPTGDKAPGVVLSCTDARSTMVVDFLQVPSTWKSFMIAVLIQSKTAVNARIAINALTSGDLENSFMFTEPLVSYVALDSGDFTGYLMAKYVSDECASGSSQIN